MNKIFKRILKGKVVVVGIGNTLKRDDGFGPMLVERLKKNRRLECIDAGTAPENYIGKIIKLNPDTVLIVDAVHLGLKPGSYEIIEKKDILKSGFTTHDISPNMFIEFLENQTKSKIYMLGIQPEDVSFGGGLSKRLKTKIDEIEDLIVKSLAV